MFNKIRNWCNSNQGLLTLLGVIVAVIAVIPFNKINLNFAPSFFQKLYLVLIYRVQIPLYLFIIIILVSLFYFLKILKRYRETSYNLYWFKGVWKCEWPSEENISGSEILTITEKGEYIIDNNHYFNISEFYYDINAKELSFYKVGVKRDDHRKLLNKLKIINNDLLEGKEENYNIKYQRLK
jgi:hypothetical protein